MRIVQILPESEINPPKSQVTSSWARMFGKSFYFEVMNFEKILGEIDRRQADVNRLRPFSRKNLQSLKEYFKIGLTYSSNALEGNTLTESETKVVIEEGITIGGKPLRDHY